MGLVAEEGIRLDRIDAIRVVAEHSGEGTNADLSQLCRTEDTRIFIEEPVSCPDVGEGDAKNASKRCSQEGVG